MKPHNDFKIDWNELEGHWYVVFRIQNKFESKLTKLNNYYFGKTPEENLMLTKYTFMDKDGEFYEHTPSKMYGTGDKTNAWYKMHKSSYESSINWFGQAFFSPLFKKRG